MEPVGAQTAPSALRDALGASYALERELGRGGMATVYSARDLRHRRHVAVKVLHPELSAVLGPERFLKEIELTASLQHPHILPLFDSGSADGLLYYVMPYVQGEALRARLERERQLPVGEAVRLAVEVAGALDYAHRHGVVHRDVKPENVLLQDGQALVADFGIALAVAQAGGARMTQTGLSLGTPQYMAPEQAMGERVIDARADVYALGAVLYEMLAGEPPFTGPTAQAVVARMMTERPRPLAALRDTVPPHVDTAVMTALAKLPADRFPSAAAFAAALVAPAAPAGVSDPRAGRHGAGSPRTAALLAAGALTVGAALGWVGASARERVSPTRAAGEWRVRFAIEPDSGALLRRTTPAIAPDGGTVVFAAEGADGTRLYARRVDDLTARPLAGTEGGEWPFFSPDGAWVGFYADGAVRKVRLDGGAVSVVAATPPLSVFYGGGWGDDDTILFVVGGRGGLYRVLAAGGRAATVPVADSTVHVLGARPLPGGRAALVTLFREGSSGHMGVLDFASGRIRPLGSGTSPRYVPGFLVYASFAGDLYRRAFDLERLAPTGPAEQIARDVQFVLDQPSFDVSPAGALVYRVGYPNVPMAGRMTLSDRAGRELQAFAARAPWTPRFSPDGQRVAYGANAPGQDLSDIWVTDLAVGTTQRVTTDGADNNDPHWGPDGRSLVYSAIRQGTNKDLVVQALDGGAARRLTARPFTEWPSGWSPDGSALLFTSVTPPLSYDIWVQPAEGGAPRPYLATAAQEYGGRVSPDGRWVAYTSNETGRFEVYVQSYPTPGRKTLVSASGGAHPVWRRDGRELYYWREDQLIAASLGPGGANAPLVVRGHMPLFRAPYVEAAHPNYDVSPDGTRFVVVTGRVRANRLVVALQTLGAGGARRAEGH